MKFFMKNIVLIIMLSLLAIHMNIAAKSLDEEHHEKIDDSPAFTVGDVVITCYELKKNLNRFLSQFKSEHKEDASQADIDAWFQTFKDRTYLLAEAKDKGYDQRKDIIEGVERMARHRATQSNGLIRDKLCDHIPPVTLEDVQKAYQLRTKIISALCVKIHDLSILDSIGLKEIAITDSSTFFKMAELLNNEKSIVTTKKAFQYPISICYDSEEEILSMTTKQAGGPFQHHGVYYFIYIRDIHHIEPRSFEKEQYKLKKLLTYAREKRVYNNYLYQIDSKAKASIDPETIDKMWKKLSSIHHEFKDLDSTMFQDIGQDTLFQYYLNDTKIQLTVFDFISIYNQLVMRKPLNKKKYYLQRQIQEIIREVYFLEEARKRDIFTEKKFQLSKQNFFKNTIIAKFIKDNKKGIIIHEAEYEAYYENNKHRFIESEYVTFTELVFNKRRDAKRFYSSRQKTDQPFDSLDLNTVKGLIKTNDKQTIRMDSKEYPKAFIQELFKLPNGGMTRHKYSYIDQHYSVFIKHDETGRYVPSLQEMRPIIDKTIREDRWPGLKSSLIDTLYQKFHFESYIDIQKLLNPNTH